MIRKPKLKLNWRYALGELTLIFLGISLAIWFNNWNDLRKRKRMEKEVLVQVYSDILSNKSDVEGDFQQLVFGLESVVNVEKHFDRNLPYIDSLCFDFYWLKQDEYAFPMKGGYENLKSQGLDLIKNDSIRTYIQAIYEFGYPRISRETPFHPDIDEYFNDYYSKHFVPNQDTTLVFYREGVNGTIRYPFYSELAGVRDRQHIGFVPLDYEALKKDPEFRVMLRQSKEYRRYKIMQYQNVIMISKWLLDHIEQELGFKAEDVPPR